MSDDDRIDALREGRVVVAVSRVLSAYPRERTLADVMDDVVLDLEEARAVASAARKASQ